jgi:Bacterial transglutaminase-like N-terminal region
MTVLEVVHETRYRYAAAVTQAHHLAYLKPVHDERQQLLEHDLQIDPAVPQRTLESDAYGNQRVFFSLTRPHRELRVRARSRVALWPNQGPLLADRSPHGSRCVGACVTRPAHATTRPWNLPSPRPTCRGWRRCAITVRPRFRLACRWRWAPSG